ncbi:hypothetical protein [Pseudoalteromonas porphyrae]|nr:hypothetical protein [Pseudoalteromonas porphyrae]
MINQQLLLRRFNTGLYIFIGIMLVFFIAAQIYLTTPHHFPSYEPDTPGEADPNMYESLTLRLNNTPSPEFLASLQLANQDQIITETEFIAVARQVLSKGRHLTIPNPLVDTPKQSKANFQKALSQHKMAQLD